MRSRRGAALVPIAGLAVLTALVVAGCGYSFRANLPPGIRAVHIPVLENRTQEPGIEDLVTQALTQAVVTGGRLRIAAAAEADARLEGSIVEYALSSLAFDRSSNVTQYRLRIALKLTLRDLRKNEVIWTVDRAEDQADFQVAGQIPVTLVRQEDALRRAAIEVSRAIVSLAFEGF